MMANSTSKRTVGIAILLTGVGVAVAESCFDVASAGNTYWGNGTAGSACATNCNPPFSACASGTSFKRCTNFFMPATCANGTLAWNANNELVCVVGTGNSQHQAVLADASGSCNNDPGGGES